MGAEVHHVPLTSLEAEGGEYMANECKPSKKVSDAGKTLSTSNSAKAKSEAGKKLADHRWANHN